ncbi:hypothetical protein PIB30_046540 [Stylosanthes scabra]|uniref:Putative plant transposon protein domain-containing protein n=1 Tax=Stylosanthes scabra TaxID=79078 RepID=A0ABU6TIF2_9FABA|nr:hypothetical protein [Stylosanthes scabra]
MVREFCANFSLAKKDHVFLRGKRIPFTEADIRHYLNIPEEAPDADQDDNFVALVKAYERGDDMNMAEIYSVIGREETNWANDPANNTIPKSINNGILNPRATAWHKIINANIDPKTRGTNFDIKHALLIYVLMAGGEVNLPRIMRVILVLRPTISTLAMSCLTWQPPPQDQPADQLPQLETSAAPTTSAPAQYSLEPTMHDIMSRFDRQDRQMARTRAMIRRAFPQADFTGLGFSSSDDSESQDF